MTDAPRPRRRSLLAHWASRPRFVLRRARPWGWSVHRVAGFTTAIWAGPLVLRIYWGWKP